MTVHHTHAHLANEHMLNIYKMACATQRSISGQKAHIEAQVARLQENLPFVRKTLGEKSEQAFLERIRDLNSQHDALLPRMLETEDNLEDTIMFGDDRVTCYYHKMWASECESFHPKSDGPNFAFLLLPPESDMLTEGWYENLLVERTNLTKQLMSVAPEHKLTWKRILAELEDNNKQIAWINDYRAKNGGE